MLSTIRRLTTTWPEMNSGFTFRDYIKSKHADLPLLQFYIASHPASGTCEDWTTRIAQSQIKVNGVTLVDVNYILRVGDVVAYTRAPWRESPSPSYVDVLYEDADMVALSKPSGLQVLPAAMFHQRTVLTLLQSHYGTSLVHVIPATQTVGQDMQPTAATSSVAGPAAVAAVNPTASATLAEETFRAATETLDTVIASTGIGKPQKGGGRKAVGDEGLGMPTPVHRLGRGTSGLLLCARTPHARRRLTELMTNKTAAAAAAAVAAQHPEQATELCFQVGEEGQPSLNTCGCGSESMVPQPQEQQPLLRKLYRALVQGIVHEDEGRVDVSIGPIPHPGVDGGLFAACPQGKTAVSMWSVLERRQRPAAAEDAVRASGGDGEAVATADSVPALAMELTDSCSVDGRCMTLRDGIGEAVAAANKNAAAAISVGGGGGSGGRHQDLQQQLGVCKDEQDKQRLRDVEQQPQEGETLLQVEILTGRPHQIRIHMAAMGHPLVGDPLYGIGGLPKVGLDATAFVDVEEGCQAAVEPVGDSIGGARRPGDCGYHLHSLELHLPHPTTGKPLRLLAPPPLLLMTAAERHLLGGTCSTRKEVEHTVVEEEEDKEEERTKEGSVRR